MAAGLLKAAWWLANPFKGTGTKLLAGATYGADQLVNDGAMSDGIYNAGKSLISLDFGEAADQLTDSVNKTTENIDGIKQGAEATKELLDDGREALTNLSEGKLPIDLDDPESTIGRAFNSVMEGDFFNMDTAKTFGGMGIGGFLLYKLFGGGKNNNDNDNDGSGFIGSALKLAVLAGAAYFIHQKFFSQDAQNNNAPALAQNKHDAGGLSNYTLDV